MNLVFLGLIVILLLVLFASNKPQVEHVKVEPHSHAVDNDIDYRMLPYYNYYPIAPFGFRLPYFYRVGGSPYRYRKGGRRFGRNKFFGAGRRPRR